MAVKTMEVETCDFCDRYTELNSCSICRRKICPTHCRVIVYENPPSVTPVVVRFCGYRKLYWGLHEGRIIPGSVKINTAGPISPALKREVPPPQPGGREFPRNGLRRG